MTPTTTTTTPTAAEQVLTDLEPQADEGADLERVTDEHFDEWLYQDTVRYVARQYRREQQSDDDEARRRQEWHERLGLPDDGAEVSR